METVRPEQIRRCPSCGTLNRVPADPKKPNAKIVCGRCKTHLDSGTEQDEQLHPLTVTDSSFDRDVVKSPLPVLLDLWAAWCGPCHMLAPTIEKLARELAGKVRVAKLNIDENPATAAKFDVRSIPTLLVFRNGSEVERLVGVQPKEEIVRRIQRHLS